MSINPDAGREPFIGTPQSGGHPREQELSAEFSEVDAKIDNLLTQRSNLRSIKPPLFSQARKTIHQLSKTIKQCRIIRMNLGLALTEMGTPSTATANKVGKAREDL